MPVHVLVAGTTQVTELSQLKKVHLKDIDENSSLVNRYVEGYLERDHGLKYIDKARRKIVLKEENILNSQMINVFFVGSYAKEFKASNGDRVCIAHAGVHRSPTYTTDLLHRCLLVVGDQNNPDVWIIPQIGTTQDGPAVGSKKNDKQRPNGQQNVGKGQASSAVGCSGQKPPGHSVKNIISDIKYTPIADLVETSKVNVYGVVKFFKPPYKTSGPDYCMIVTIVDPSIDPDSSALKCVLFHPDKTALPQIYSVGDIVRFHRLKITTFHGEFQGQKGPGFACLTFSGKKDAPFEPRTSSKCFTVLEQDKKKVKELQDWAQTTNFFKDQKALSLGDVIEGQYFDLTGQVIAKTHIPEDSCVVLRIWDGTKCQLRSRKSLVHPTQVEDAQDLLEKADHLAVDVFVYDDHVPSALQLNPGDFIKLFNLHSPPYKPSPYELVQVELNLEPGMIEFNLHKGTSYGRGLMQLNQNQHEVREMMRIMEDPPPPSPESTNSTEVPHDNDAVTTNEVGQVQGPGKTNHTTVSNANQQNITGTDQSDGNRVTLEKVTVGQYFDLSCQVISTAPLPESRCICVKVWDATKCKLKSREIDCSHACVSMKPMLQTQAGNLAVDVGIYDNHVADAEQIKPGDFITLVNLHAARYPPRSRPSLMQESMIEFALHGGTQYNRHVAILKETDVETDVLRRRLNRVTGKAPSTSSIQRNQNQSSSTSSTSHGLSSSTRYKASTQSSSNSSGQRSGRKSGGNLSFDIPSDFEVWDENLPPNHIPADAAGHTREDTNGGPDEGQRLRCMERSLSYTVGHVHIAFQKISDVLASHQPYKFKIRAKVVNYTPRDARDWVHLFCPTCKLRCAIPGSASLTTDSTKTSPSKSSEIHNIRRSPRKHGSSLPSTSKEVANLPLNVRRPGLRKRGGTEAHLDSDSSSQESTARERPKRKRPQVKSGSPMRENLRQRKQRNYKEESTSSAQSGTETENERDNSISRTSTTPSASSATTGQRFTVFQVDDTAIESSASQGEERFCLILENATPQQLVSGRGFRLLHQPKVRLVDVSPSEAKEDAIFLCPRCKKGKNKQEQRKYEMKCHFYGILHLSDGSGVISVIIHGDKAIQFFNGLQPTNLHKNQEKAALLQNILAKLCSHPMTDNEGANDITDDGDWLECCVMSYKPNSGGDEFKYQIFDTCLVTEED